VIPLILKLGLHINAKLVISNDLHIQTKDFDKSQGIAKSGMNKNFINFRILQMLHDYIKKDIELGDRHDYTTVKAIRDYLLSEKLYNNQIYFFF
jgi:hypothetical protein